MDKSTGIGDLGTVKWDLTLCLLLVFIIIYFSLWKGMQQTGKVSIWIKSVFMNLLSISGKSGLFGVVVVDDVGLLLLVVLFVFRGFFVCFLFACS